MRALARAIALLLAAAGCRGEPSQEPPIRLIQDMNRQPKARPEAASPLFEDGRAMRPPVEGTVARGELKADDVFWRGRTGEGFVARVPGPVDASLMRRGRERFDIFCSPCHDRTGGGRGMVVQRGYPPAVDLTGDRVRGMADGEIFGVVSNGVRNMPSYAAQIPEADRWAVVAWLRVLQRSQRATLTDVPPGERDRILPEGVP